MTPPPPTLLLTRPRAQSERFAEDALAVLGPDITIVISPVLRIEPRTIDVDFHGLAGVVLTSENGLLALQGLATPPGLIAYCVGDRTASAAEAAGLSAISAGGAVEDLAAMIRAAPPEGPLLHLRGANTRGDLHDALGAAGIELRSVIAYDQAVASLTSDAAMILAGDGAVVAPLFSPRSAELLAVGAASATAPMHLLALSEAVADAWNGPKPASLTIAARSDAFAMLDALVTIYTGKLA